MTRPSQNTYEKLVIGAGLLIAVATGIWLYFQYESVKQSVVDKRKAETAAYIQKRAAALIRPRDFENGDAGRRARAFESFFQAIQSPDLVRMKVWDRNYAVVWSNFKDLIGQRFPDNREVEEALEGKVEFEFAKGKGEHLSERLFKELSETYVPIPNGRGAIVGVIEVYQPTAALREEIRSRFQKAVIGSVLVALACFTAIMVLLRSYAHAK